MKPTFKADGFIIVAGYRIRLQDTAKGRRYQVDLGTKSGKHVRKSFSDKQKAEQFARDAGNEAQRDGIASHKFTARQKTDAVEALKILEKHGASLRDAAHYFDKHHKAIDSNNGIGHLIDSYCAENKERLERKEIRPRSYSEIVKRMKQFKASYEGTAIDALEARDLDAWFDVKSTGATDRANLKRYVSGFYNWCVKSDRLDVNPVAKCRTIKKAIHTPEIYTPAQVESILQSACTFADKEVERLKDGKRFSGYRSEIVPYLAIGFFAGIRPNEITRLRWEDVNLELGEIYVNADTSKTSRARIVHIPANLKKYLVQYGEKSGLVFPVSEANRKRWMKEINESAGVKPIQDGARKMFATMHLAQHDSIDDTLLELGHVDSKMLFTHYRGLASNRKAQAKKYWKIEPVQAGKIIPLSKAG